MQRKAKSSRSMKRAGQDEEDDLLLQRGNVQVGQSPFDGPPLKYIISYLTNKMTAAVQTLTLICDST